MPANDESLSKSAGSLILMAKIIFVTFLFLAGFGLMLKIINYPGQGITLRPFPYPYRAGLAFAGDVEGIDTAEEFLFIQRYLCTDEETHLGEGLGLEVGSGFRFYDFTGTSSFTLFDTSGKLTETAPLIRDFISFGFIDILNGYGDPADSVFKFELVEKALEFLKVESLEVPIWINLRQSDCPHCIGTLPNQCGDDSESPYYHADFLPQIGVKYIEASRFTYVVGQDAAYDIPGWFKKVYEFIRSVWMSFRGKRWNIDPGNLLLSPFTLDDGQEFMRFMLFIGDDARVLPQDVDVGDLARQIRPEILDRLIYRKGYMLLSTRLGVNSSYSELIPPDAREALRGLSERAHKGEILTTTASRLLDYNLAHRFLKWHWERDSDEYEIFIDGIDHPFDEGFETTLDNLPGLTFYTPNPEKTRIFFHREVINPIKINPEDETGMGSVSIPWEWLKFPPGY